ncbi:MAG: hypothetical protein ABSF98_04305 [Bryobacteraceae bacterium]|jgi:hypothetical protein
MLIFPQLRSGAVAQLPLQRSEDYRTLRNVLSDGSIIQMSDVGFARVGWTLKFTDLAADEAQALQSLFQSAEGRLNTFSFVDPSANLLCWSEDLTRPSWSTDPQLALSGVQDAFGGASGTQITNGAAVAQSISQTTNAPAALQYCFSAYLRSDGPTQVTFEIGGAAVVTASVSGTWQRWEAVSTGGTGQQAVFGLSIPAGLTVQVCGLQTEAQPAAGVYKSTTDTGGVFPNSRFDQDSMDITATEAGFFACNVRIVSQLQGA